MADAQSAIGDQLARVALAVLVFHRSGSDLATAATYALTYLPAVFGGVFLAGLADRYPRRAVLVTCDIIRAGLIALVAVPHLPLGALYALVVAVVLAGGPYGGAEPALVADFFDGEQYTTANGLRSSTSQFAQLLGFGVGGLTVAALGTTRALLIDAATFALSALLIHLAVRARPASGPVRGNPWTQLRDGLRTVAGSSRLRVLLGLGWLAGFWIVPEGLAVPYAGEHAAGATAAGLLLAANPAGSLLGALVLSRWTSGELRRRLIGPLAVAAGVPLALCAVDPGVVVAGLLWGVCGLLSGYLVVVFPEYVTGTVPALRGRAVGLASAGLCAAQGLGLLLGGALASAATPAGAISVLGVAGSLCAAPLALAWRRELRRPPNPARLPGQPSVMRSSARLAASHLSVSRKRVSDPVAPPPVP